MSPEEVTRAANDAALNKAEVWRANRNGIAVRIGLDGKPTGQTERKTPK